MASIHRKCEDCGKIAEVAAEIKLAFGRFITLKCGHSLILKSIVNEELIKITSRTGKELFPFQAQTIKFMEDAGGVCLVGHEMALGKTICAAGFIGRNKAQCLPVLVLCRSSIKINWMRELLDWAGIVSQVVDKGYEKPILDVFPITIMSVDMLGRVTSPTITKGGRAGVPNPDHWDESIWKKYKTVIVDECQSIKNPASKRSQALKNHLSEAQFRIPMSGTTIKNAADEYFTVLNYLRPELFPSYAGFINNWTIGRHLRRPELFKAKTEDFIIRYERKDVLPDLPKIMRTFRAVRMDDAELINRYKDTVKEFSDWMEKNEEKMSPMGYVNLLAFFAKMRHITGVAKVPAAIDYVEEFLLECDRKLVIFLHHKSTATLMVNRLNKTMADMGQPPVLSFNSSLSGEERQEVIDKFWKPENRIMVASTLAAGEGINLQCCSDCLIMERQWNPANEEQAEARFPRPGQTADKINAVYLTALGTIDEFLSDLIETKRRAVKAALDNRELTWEESSLMRDLAQAIFDSGQRPWSF